VAARPGKAGEDRKCATGVYVVGRKALAETNPDAVKLAKRLRRVSPKIGERMSLRKIASVLAAAGHLNERGQPFNAKSIQAMIDGPQSRKGAKSEYRNGNASDWACPAKEDRFFGKSIFLII
jgi:hypothetical protein